MNDRANNARGNSQSGTSDRTAVPEVRESAVVGTDSESNRSAASGTQAASGSSDTRPSNDDDGQRSTGAGASGNSSEGGTTTAVASTEKGIPDLSVPKVAARFAEMISAGKLDRLTAQQQSMFLAGLGAYIGVKPELGDLMIYQGKPYITISGYRRIAHNSGLLNGLPVEPASERDLRRFGVQEGEYLWIARAYKRGCAYPFTGWGYVRKGDKNPVSKSHPQEMAKKRAIYDALRLAFPPNEMIGSIHMKYIDEAEAAAARMNPSRALAEVDDYPDEVMAEEVGADEAASASADREPLGTAA